jgi:hypothetical protein
MPGCELELFGCSHGKSIDYFTESILKPNAFKSKACPTGPEDNCCRQGLSYCGVSVNQYMGFNVNKTLSGSFFVETNSKSPYSKS